MKILIVEDEHKTGDYLKQGLTESGFVTELAVNGVDGLRLALTGDFDLLVLDVMLPGLSGWQVLERLRQSGKEMPILFLTARDQVEDRVKGLELGADDYLSFWPVCAPCCDGEKAAWRPMCCMRQTWSWI
jgi:two-component system copper resistance phosphate regulon response regulator CusR